MDSNKEDSILGVNLSAVLDDYVTSSAAYESADTITLSTLGSINSGLGSVSLSSPYTVTGSMTSPSYSIGAGVNTATPWFSQGANGASGKITLNGESADVEVNGWSLVAAVKRIEERLGLFQPNPGLEQEWSELKQLGDQYRKLEQHIRDKQATFDRLKAMPAPIID
jgi:hypothetical protein